MKNKTPDALSTTQKKQALVVICFLLLHASRFHLSKNATICPIHDNSFSVYKQFIYTVGQNILNRITVGHLKKAMRFDDPPYP